MNITGVNPILDLFIIAGHVGMLFGTCIAVGFGLYIVTSFTNVVLEFLIGATGCER